MRRSSLKQAGVCVVASLFICFSSPALAAELTIIDLRHRSADEVIPTLRPMIGSDVALSGIDYKLLVRGSAMEVAKIRELLAVLDRAPRQLLISVRYSGGRQDRANDLGVDATADPRGARITARGNSSIATASDASVSTVRVLEGNAAHIATGQSVPIVTAAFVPPVNARGSGIGIATEYRDVASGFDVTPRVNGDRVVLEISAQRQRLTDTNSGAADVQRVTTTVGGRLGDWLDLGGVVSSIDDQRSTVGIAGGGQRIATRSDRHAIAVKVEQVD
jgi:hypothetical protein